MWRRILGLSVLIAILTGCLLSVSPGSASVIAKTGYLTSEPLDLKLEALLPGLDWSAWYQQKTGVAPDPTYFGAYVTLGAGDALYLGMGTARPAETDGALVARFDGWALSTLGALKEQGIHEMLWGGETLHIAGTDPCCPDGWEAGNHYTYRPPGPLVKHRDPENGLSKVVHTWGLWMSEEGVLYAAVSSDDRAVPAAQLFISTDNGDHWSYLSTMGENRSYDVIGLEDKLYVLSSDSEEGPIQLKVSEDGGESWQLVLEDALQRTRLTPFEGALLTVSEDRKQIIAIREDAIERYDLPVGFTLGSTYTDPATYGDYHLMVVGDGYLYALLEPAQAVSTRTLVVRTKDLLEWQPVTGSAQRLISLSYWEAKQTLILGGQGQEAAIWKIELATPTPPAYLYLPLLRQ